MFQLERGKSLKPGVQIVAKNQVLLPDFLARSSPRLIAA